MDIFVENLSKVYGSQRAVDNISFQVKTGEVLGFLGPNGAGKTTTMKAITSYLTPTSGKIRVGEYSVADEPEEVKKLIGYLPEQNPLYEDMPVLDYLRFVAELQGIKKEHIKGRMLEMVRVCGLEGEKHKKIGELSKGYKQRVGLAQALIHDPDVLILDEPTSGLDPNQLVEIRKIITELGKKKTIILSTHIMQEVEALCTRVIIIDHGKIVADDTPNNLSKKDKKTTSYKVEFKEDVNKHLLEMLPGIDKVKNIGKNNWLLSSHGDIDLRENIFKFAVKNKFNVLSLSMEEQKMEDIFQRLTH